MRDSILVAEPKATWHVLDAFGGRAHVLYNDWYDDLMRSVAPQRGKLRAGSTVAHLSLYLAEHLGCDPIILIGQDLSFSEGLYYPAGMPIEQIWRPELNRFCTVEMKQWERVRAHAADRCAWSRTFAAATRTPTSRCSRTPSSSRAISPPRQRESCTRPRGGMRFAGDGSDDAARSRRAVLHASVAGGPLRRRRRTCSARTPATRPEGTRPRGWMRSPSSRKSR